MSLAPPLQLGREVYVLSVQYIFLPNVFVLYNDLFNEDRTNFYVAGINIRTSFELNLYGWYWILLPLFYINT